MTVSELMAELAKRAVRISEIHSAQYEKIDPDQIEVVLWDGEDTASVRGVDYDRFEQDGPLVIIIKKDGDP